MNWLVKGYSYLLKATSPTSVDSSYPVGYVWIDLTTNVAYVLDSVVDGVATWVVKRPDSVINEGTGGQINVIGETALGDSIRVPGSGTIVPSGAIVSDPAAGEYRVTNIRVDQNKKLVAEYDEDPA